MNRQMFFPSQPDLTTSTSYYREFRPQNFTNRQDIAVYYEFTVKALHCNEHDTITLIPDGCFDILFYLDENHPQAYLWTTPYSRKEQKFLHPQGSYFGVRFWPEQTSILFKEHMQELVEQVIPLNQLLVFDEAIYDKLLNAQNLQQRIHIFDQFLQHIKQQALHETLIVKYVTNQLYESYGCCSLKVVSESAGYSQQYIRRVFERFIGFSPKQFAQVIQLQRTLLQIESQKVKDLQDLTFEAGYYDQAHFIKNFKKFMHTTPKRYIRQKDGRLLENDEFTHHK